MSSRSCTDPFGGLNPLVDKVLGPKAYDVVKFVALRMPWIQRAAAEPYTRLSLVGHTAGLVTSLLFPPTVSLERMFDSAIWIIDPVTGARYNAESGYFTTAYGVAGVTISLKEDAPIQLQSAVISWSLTALEVVPMSVGALYAPIA